MKTNLNILLITVDDMNWDAVGAFGCPVEGTTPNIDRIAEEGIKFNYGHVTIAVCEPSRSVMMTGLYPHNSKGEGFFRLREKGVPLLPELLREAGYAVGLMGKLAHSTPYEEFEWDMSPDRDELGSGRNPKVYRSYADTFIAKAKEQDKPFFLMANTHDPHRPFYGNDPEDFYDKTKSDPPAVKPSRVFQPEEITVPGHLADIPEVKLELSEYYSSVRRADDMVGEMLEALEKSGTADNTLVLFLSDNGMAFPFAKTNCYLNSTRTPWLMRWPGVIEPGTVDSEHFVSGIDILPTFLDAAGVSLPENVDGSSFLPVLKGEKQAGRETVFTQFHQTAARNNYPMRCVQNKQYGYIYNPWSNGERIFKNESQAGRTFKAMQEAAEQNEQIAKRVKLFLYRVPEELYDFASDPSALNNLVDDPEYVDVLEEMRKKLESYMEETDDPALEAFRARDDRDVQEKLIEEMINEIGGK